MNTKFKKILSSCLKSWIIGVLRSAIKFFLLLFLSEEKEGQGENSGTDSVFPLRRKVTAGPAVRPRGKFGRGFLAPSHAGTRLPIAVRRAPACRRLPYGPGPGRSPSARSRKPGTPVMFSSPRSSLSRKSKTADTHVGIRLRKLS